MRQFLLITSLIPLLVTAQLKPGYDKNEAAELLKVNFQFRKNADSMGFPKPERFHLVYQSQGMATENAWEWWEDKNGMAVISIRASNGTKDSWISNFDSGMIPASGCIPLSPTDTFFYDLAPNPNAAVHAGWMFSTGVLVHDMMPRLQKYLEHRKEIYIAGHSQGGALATLITATLHSMMRKGTLPKDLKIKTYAAAGPKTGNLFFAYQFESETRGWYFNTVNAADWVPESPFSVQTRFDLNCTNPITDAKPGMKRLPLIPRIFVKHVYNRLDRATRKTQRLFDKYSVKIGKQIAKSHPGYKQPDPAGTANYVRVGQQIVLMPDAEYYQRFPDYSDNKFIHHQLDAYLMLIDKY